MKERTGCGCLLVAIVLWTTWIVPAELQNNGLCGKPGWFGSNCTYKCRCAFDQPCDGTTGECTRKFPCAYGWFGPGCQYYNTYVINLAPDTPLFLSDLNKTTCHPDPQEQTITVKFNVRMHITWFRIHLDTDISKYGLDLVPDNETCRNKQLYRVEERILDVNCDSTGDIKKLTLQGPDVGHICYIEISGGRNLAIKQETQQSSNPSGISELLTRSQNAVDGSRMNNMDSGSCAHTDKVRGIPWWTVQLRLVSNLTNIVVYNIDTYLNRSSHSLVVEVFRALDDLSPKKFYDLLAKGRAVYDINVGYITAIKINISARENSDFYQNYLTLCEVEVYGEVNCPTNTYGLHCQESCRCGPTESCSQVTGLCSASLPGNRSGPNSSPQCHPNCLSRLCQSGDDCVWCVASECRSCKLGYFGTYCDEECPKGKFGQGCENECSSNCSDSLCNSTSGDCFSCSGGRNLPLCLDEEGIRDKEEEFNWLWLLLLLLIPLVICLVCCFFCCWRKKTKTPPAVDTPKPPSAQPQVEEVEEPVEELNETESSVDLELKESGSEAKSSVAGS